jgi:phosphoribosyl 1,2-cyclic phosphodiesterase
LVKVSVLGSGSRGNCTLVQGGRTRILVDAGFSGVETERRLRQAGESLDSIDLILVTHEHSDHVGGVGPIARKRGIPVACHEDTLSGGRLADGAIPEWIRVEAGKSLSIGDLVVEPFEVPHDASMTLGFRIRAEGIAIGYCTDLGHVTPVVRDRLASCNVLILESNHDLDMLRDGDYPWHLKQRIGSRHGHLSNEASAELLADIVDGEAMVIALAHLSESNNEPALALAIAQHVLSRTGRESVRLLATHQDRVAEVVQA